MVNAEKIKKDYLQLLQLIEKEVLIDPSVRRYLNYLTKYKDKFIGQDHIPYQLELKEFLRGANRFSDEFTFSDQNTRLIQTLLNRLYEAMGNS
ncbi:hypothetical protein [Sphingobacterium sp. JB170]|uniref:hypothetical protein n=1 Tax=Sphingobacterium sp. JB170 TaxID=1434842 RepID=UPI00097F2C6F|nr:hypothetical protein [Sphingobacterium sp. JB170]SJN48068.1 hypothetical protein FM107_16705 [Sphingobacterium sp. JB170]